MINLLPDTHKSQIRAARTNVILLRYIIIMLVAVVVLGGLVGASYVVLKTAQTDAEAKVAENQQRVTDYESVRLQAEAFRADLAVAKTVLDNEVQFSKLLYKIAAAVPRGVILNELTLDPNQFGSSFTLNANAKSFKDATRLRDSFSSNTELFSNVQLLTVRSGEGGSVASGEYPVQVTLSLVINKGAAQ